MGSRMADSLAVVRRAKKAGWRVEPNGDGQHYVWDAAGRKHVVHNTYSDGRWSLKNLVADLERGGLIEAEQKMANTRVTETRSKLQIAREKAEEEAKRLANGARLTKAAGPYLTDPEPCDLGWLTTPHPLPWMKWMYLDGETAQTLLDEFNADNRPLNERQVEHYRRIIMSPVPEGYARPPWLAPGQWHLTHQGLAIDTRGMVQDGQHRLRAVVEAAEETEELLVPFAVFVGMPQENFKAIDEGLLRTAAHLFGKSHEKNGSTLANAIRLVNAYKDGNPRRQIRLKVPNQVIIDTFEENPEEFRDCANVGQAAYRKVNAQAGAIAAARYVIRRANLGAENPFVTAFFEGLITGRKAGTRQALDDDDPRAVFREFMLDVKTKRRARRIVGIDAMAMIILSWNNCVTGNHSRTFPMRFTEESPIPRVVVCLHQGPNASVVPRVFYGEVPGDDEA